MSAGLGKVAFWIILVALLTGCSGPRQPELELAREDSVELRPGCEIERVAETIAAYLERYSSGQTVPLEQHFAPVANDRLRPHYYSHGFQWFADNGGTDGGFRAYWPVARSRRTSNGSRRPATTSSSPSSTSTPIAATKTGRYSP